ncbi:MAG: hypothetical protein ACPGUV_11245, partial [Polyangiales bacterium]
MDACTPANGDYWPAWARWTMVGSLLLSVLALHQPVRADNAKLRRLSAQLRHYHHNARTYHTLKALKALSQRAKTARTRREARFIRAITATDLSLYARLAQRPKLLPKLSRALGVAPKQLPGYLHRELKRNLRGVFLPVARDAFAAHTAAIALQQGKLKVARKTYGKRSQLVRAHALAARLAQGKSIIAQLARNPDPCATAKAQPAPASEQQTTSRCPALFRPFAPQSRRALIGYRKLHRLLNELEHDKRDPFLRLVRPLSTHLHEAFDNVKLDLAPALTNSDPLVTVPQGRYAAPAPGLIIWLHADRIEHSWLPIVKRADDGRLALIGPKPYWPERGRHPLPGDLPAFMRPIAAIEKLATEWQERNQSKSAAIAPAPDIPAHLIGRLMLSLAGGGVTPAALWARQPSGTLAALPVQVQ